MSGRNVNDCAVAALASACAALVFVLHQRADQVNHHIAASCCYQSPLGSLHAAAQ